MLAASVGVNDFRMNDFAVRSFIKLEMFGVAEMPKNLTVFIGNCNFHNEISFAFFVEFFCVGSLHPAAPWRSWHGRFPSSVFGIYRLWHFEQKKAIFSKAATFSVLICVPADIHSRKQHVSLVRNSRLSKFDRTSQGVTNFLGFTMSLVYMQAIHGRLSTYERLVNNLIFCAVEDAPDQLFIGDCTRQLSEVRSENLSLIRRPFCLISAAQFPRASRVTSFPARSRFLARLHPRTPAPYTRIFIACL